MEFIHFGFEFFDALVRSSQLPLQLTGEASLHEVLERHGDNRLSVCARGFTDHFRGVTKMMTHSLASLALFLF
jgi:hypothetical protein